MVVFLVSEVDVRTALKILFICDFLKFHSNRTLIIKRYVSLHGISIFNVIVFDDFFNVVGVILLDRL